MKNFKVNWETFKRIAYVFAFVGGLLGLITTYHQITTTIFAKPKIKAKIIGYATTISNFSNTNEFTMEVDSFKGMNVIIKIAINVSNKDLNYFDIIPFAKLKKDFIEGTFYFPKDSYVWKIEDKEHFFKVPNEDLLYYNSVLKKESTNIGYLTFFIQDDLIASSKPKDRIIPQSYKFDFVSSEDNGIKYSTGEIKIDFKNNWIYQHEKEKWIPKTIK